MINLLKKIYYKVWLKHHYSKIQSSAKATFRLRDKNIKRGEKFSNCVKKLESLGVKNPKTIVLGQRPPTGKIK